ncbi:hypothetical protein NEK97_15815 [Paenarthrobacter sp. UW852]|uniref:hypothetical protein n=1 Tax=Paenarthrobacter sp. UW852 TaxID=2951989 RepID=UPI00214864AE|nr:hypothetical protein [Paenarthrobacter sp. UW852]MCR1162930.1 hypothetical protein [Paenarthrobacter sp. UW852]
MSEHFPPRGRHDAEAIDHLLAGSGLEGDAGVRAELLELRSLAATAPLPSEAVRALMVPAPAVRDQPAAHNEPAAHDELAAHNEPAAHDELAARRRKKRRAAIAGLAVVVSLAGGATAAAASEGGIPGAFQHLGAAIGSVVSQLAPGAGSAPKQGGPAGSTTESPSGDVRPTPVQSQPGQAPALPEPSAHERGSQAQPGGSAATKAPKVPSRGEPGNGVIPTPPAVPVTPPAVVPPTIDPGKLRPSDLPVPVPIHVEPSPPVIPSK